MKIMLIVSLAIVAGLVTLVILSSSGIVFNELEYNPIFYSPLPVVELNGWVCKDSDAIPGEPDPFNVKGMVTVTNPDGEVSVYPDKCKGTSTIEALCNRDTADVLLIEVPCEQTCYNGACLSTF